MKSVYARYVIVWAALVVLLAATLASAYVPMGIWNGITNLAIAAMKASLVALVFMGLKSTTAPVRLAAAIGFFMLILLFGLSAADYVTRETYPAAWQTPAQLR